MNQRSCSRSGYCRWTELSLIGSCQSGSTRHAYRHCHPPHTLPHQNNNEDQEDLYCLPLRYTHRKSRNKWKDETTNEILSPAKKARKSSFIL